MRRPLLKCLSVVGLRHSDCYARWNMEARTDSSSLSKEQLLIVAGLMTAVSLAALDMTVVATVMPTVAGALGGLDLFSWTFSVYLLTSTVTVPIYGKLADLYGRKPILLG